MRRTAVPLCVLLLAGCLSPTPAPRDVPGPEPPFERPGTEGVRARHLLCDINATSDGAAMESEHVGACWAHIGIHHYFLGRSETLLLHNGSGKLFVVEQQYSPPTELGGPPQPGTTVNTTVPVEVSVDGLAWELVTTAGYRYLSAAAAEPEARQEINFTFEGQERPFRFLRVREPLSAAQGLSGYIDFSELWLNVTVAAQVAPSVRSPRIDVEKRCETDILEDVFAEHPCWFGGIDRWDAPSFFHTYFLGDARIDRVTVEATVLDFRPDDSIGDTETTLWLQASLDGVRWTTLVTAPATYGQSTTLAASDLDSRPTAFLRLVTDWHSGKDDRAPWKHPEGYLYASRLLLTGQLS